ncbi:hypothetical protein ScPMuIL_007512 [Solemya velum]
MAIEIDEPTLLDNFLHYGLLLGAVFQLVCIFAVIWLPKSEPEQEVAMETQSATTTHPQHAPQHSHSTSKRKREKKKTR